MVTLLKGTVSQDFGPQFFRQTIPLGPTIHGLMWFRICGDIRLQKSTPRCDAWRGVEFLLDKSQIST
jgi:hypothetical protein